MTAKLSNFISLEFFNSNSSKQEENHEEDVTAIYSWIHENTEHGKLTAPLNEGEVYLRGKSASMFHRNGQQIEDVLAEFSRDLRAYESIYKTNKNALTEFGKAQKGIVKDLERIADPETTFDQVRAVIMKYNVESRKFGEGNSIAHHFHEPTTRFLGDYETGFLNGRDEFQTIQHLKKYKSAELPSLTEENRDAIVKLAFDIQGLQTNLTDLEERIGVCIDHTDSPIRGFIGDISEDKELMPILNPFSEHGMVHEDHNGGLVDILVKRVDNLYEALWNYIKHSCH